jgi:hypothetical protein
MKAPAIWGNRTANWCFQAQIEGMALISRAVYELAKPRLIAKP